MNSSPTDGFVELSESPGDGATHDQLSMLYTRYHHARNIGRGREVLEVACGAGFGVRYLSEASSRYVATDIDPAFVRSLRERHGNDTRIEQVDAEALPYAERSFDVVLMLEAIYYVPRAEKFIAEAARILRPGGTLLVVSANPERRAFNPGARTARYLSATELATLMSSEGLKPRAYGAFPESNIGIRALVGRMARFVAVSLKLIPTTMRAKEKLKRVFFGPLVPLPSDVTDGMAPLGKLTPLGAPPHRGYNVIYVEGTKS